MFDSEPELKQAYEALEALGEDDARRVVNRYIQENPSGFPTNEKYRFRLWLLLLGGVMLIAVVGVVAATILASNKLDATAAWVLATAATTGVLALFAKSPVDKSV